MLWMLVGHDDESVVFETRVGGGDFVPGALNHSASRIQIHLVIADITELVSLVLRADGHDRETRGSVVEPRETDRTLVVPFRIERRALSVLGATSR